MMKTTKTTKTPKTRAGKPAESKTAPAPVNSMATSAPAPAPVAAVAPKPAPAPKMEPPKPVAVPSGGRVALEFVQPGAHEVYVAGSFNEWKPECTPLKQAGDGRWVGALSVKPGRHEYLFVVDGQWMPDPNAKESVQNPFGGQNSVLIVSE